MDEKEKLIELIINAPKIPIVICGRNTGRTYQTVEHLVDHLIANGVTVNDSGTIEKEAGHIREMDRTWDIWGKGW